MNRSIQIRLPQLVIENFEGTHLDWFRFWNQFEADINKVEISAKVDCQCAGY